MKKILFLLFFIVAFSAAKSQLRTGNPKNTVYTHDEVVAMLENQYDSVEFVSNAEFFSGAQTSKKVYATISWVDLNTGCMGYTTYWVHSFLGVTWGSIQATDTVVTCL